MLLLSRPHALPAMLYCRKRHFRTSPFFRAAVAVPVEEEDVGEQGASSKHYWIGKDLARARDEVIFYEVAKTLQGKEGWQILNFMTPYKGRSLRGPDACAATLLCARCSQLLMLVAEVFVVCLTHRRMASLRKTLT